MFDFNILSNYNVKNDTFSKTILIVLPLHLEKINF